MNDKRVERNRKALAALAALLHAVLENPAEYISNTELVDSLKSQGALAHFSDESLSITGTSLNTMKRIAEEMFAGGFGELNRFRLAALNALHALKHKQDVSNKTTKAGLQKRVKELEQDNQKLREELELLTFALARNMGQAKRYAERSGIRGVIELCVREQRDLLAMFELDTRRPLKIVNLHEKK